MKKTIYEDGDKVLYETDNEDEILCKFIDEVVDGKGHIKGTVKNKASINAAIAAHMFKLLTGYHIPTCLRNQKTAKEMILKRAEEIPIEITVIKESSQDGLVTPVFRYTLLAKSSKKSITAEEIVEANIITYQTLAVVRRLALKIKVVLDNYFQRRKFELLGFCVQFGYINGKIAVCRPLTLENFEIKDIESKTKYKSSYFVSHLDDAVHRYEKVYNQIMF